MPWPAGWIGCREYCCCASCCVCFKKVVETMPLSQSFFLDRNSTAFTHSTTGGGGSGHAGSLELSYIGKAAYDALKIKHFWHRRKLWNVTSGSVTRVDHTPHQALVDKDIPEGHSDWLPQKLEDIISRTTVWCDLVALSPPDGLFLEHISAALQRLHEKDISITVRFLFAHILGMSVNCKAVLRRLVEGIDASTTKLRVWVGAWRKNVSWNHAKIIAVDGCHLYTGGHNLWDQHYLKVNPAHDLSIELQGPVSHDGHLYANEQWKFIERMRSNAFGYVIANMPDWVPMALKAHVTVRRFPREKLPRFPPSYKRKVVEVPAAAYAAAFNPNTTRRIPIVTLGRYGKLTHMKQRPSDDAIVEMLGSARKSVRLALQDLGPVCVPATSVALPGCVWPHAYLHALAKVIWERNVVVEIVVSNPLSIPGELSLMDACYGNGWTCIDVAAEVIMEIKKQFPLAKDEDLRQRATNNLRVCFMRGKRGNKWEDGMTMGLHSKHFIIDDICCYIGSQNLYVCDLGEWGVLIDDEEATINIMDAFWNPLWEASYRPEDCNVEAVMDGLEINRDGPEDLEQYESEEIKEMVTTLRKQNTRGYREFGLEGSVYTPNNRESFFFANKEEEIADDDEDEVDEDRVVFPWRHSGRFSVFSKPSRDQTTTA